MCRGIYRSEQRKYLLRLACGGVSRVMVYDWWTARSQHSINYKATAKEALCWSRESNHRHQALVLSKINMFVLRMSYLPGYREFVIWPWRLPAINIIFFYQIAKYIYRTARRIATPKIKLIPVPYHTSSPRPDIACKIGSGKFKGIFTIYIHVRSLPPQTPIGC